MTMFYKNRSFLILAPVLVGVIFSQYPTIYGFVKSDIRDEIQRKDLQAALVTEAANKVDLTPQENWGELIKEIASDEPSLFPIYAELFRKTSMESAFKAMSSLDAIPSSSGQIVLLTQIPTDVEFADSYRNFTKIADNPGFARAECEIVRNRLKEKDIVSEIFDEKLMSCLEEKRPEAGAIFFDELYDLSPQIALSSIRKASPNQARSLIIAVQERVSNGGAISLSEFYLEHSRDELVEDIVDALACAVILNPNEGLRAMARYGHRDLQFPAIIKQLFSSVRSHTDLLSICAAHRLDKHYPEEFREALSAWLEDSPLEVANWILQDVSRFSEAILPVAIAHLSRSPTSEDERILIAELLNKADSTVKERIAIELLEIDPESSWTIMKSVIEQPGSQISTQAFGDYFLRLSTLDKEVAVSAIGDLSTMTSEEGKTTSGAMGESRNRKRLTLATEMLTTTIASVSPSGISELLDMLPEDQQGEVAFHFARESIKDSMPKALSAVKRIRKSKLQAGMLEYLSGYWKVDIDDIETENLDPSAVQTAKEKLLKEPPGIQPMGWRSFGS